MKLLLTLKFLRTRSRRRNEETSRSYGKKKAEKAAAEAAKAEAGEGEEGAEAPQTEDQKLQEEANKVTKE